MNSTSKAKHLKTLIFLPIFLLFIGLVKGADTFTIQINSPLKVDYCNLAVPVASDLLIQTTIPITGMKVSFSQGYVYPEDVLELTNTSVNIVGTWSASQGYLLLQPNSNALPTTDDYIKALESVQYRNNKTVPTLGVREITITLMDADYLPLTQHFYKYIPQNGITWTAAKAAAATSNYFGLQGYLATITSAEENLFISLKTLGTGWIGASDAAVEGEWRWVTGPEGKNGGLLFWKGSGYMAKIYPLVYGPVKDASGVSAYQNWNYWTKAYTSPSDSLIWEPNNSGGTRTIHGEDYAHILNSIGSSDGSRYWNDLSNTGSTDATSDYYPRGYLVEYGGMEDYTLNLSATVSLQVNTISFNTKPISPICAGESVTLNQPRDNGTIPVTYSWTPAASFLDASAANPVATPLITTKYTVNADRNGSCPVSLDFKVTVNPKPIIDLSVDSKTCYGYNLEVMDKGDVNSARSNFTWIFGTDTIATGLGLNSTIIPLGVEQSNRDLKLLVVDQNNCSNQKTVSDILVKPNLSPFTVKDTILCLPELFEFSVTPDPSVITYDWDFGDGTSGSGLNPTHKYQKSKKYDIQLTVTNKDNCTNTAVIKEMVFAAPVPVAEFSISDTIIYTNKPNVSFLDGSTLAANWSWNFGDSLTSVLQNPVHNYKGTGIRIIWLKVTSDFNCVDSVSHHLLIAFDRIFPPNGFSPNAPNTIDRVFLLNSEGIKSAGYHFVVLSRWDDIVFEVKDEIKGWDGRMKDGSFAPAGTYLWVLNYNDFLDEKHRQTGTVTLIY